MKTVTVELAGAPRRYPILIEPGLLASLGNCFKEHLPDSCRKLLLVCDPNVQPLFGKQVQEQLKSAGYAVYSFTIPEGEEAKSLSVAQTVFDFALEAGLSRKDAMVALGGGVVGDLTGFCAATYYRGVPFVQIPTTLLAQVDSSVGGKVAVNFKHAKNGIGAFYQPRLVVIDPDVLASLPEKQIRAGLAEVVKYALIEKTCNNTQDLFKMLSDHAGNLSAIFPGLIEYCCRIKAAVVSQDETETTGFRSYLNLGHTFAHAYEEITGYKTLLHGEAVAIGLQKACLLSEKLGLFPSAERAKIENLLAQLSLVYELPENLEPLRLLDLMRHDKKADGNRLKFILPVGEIGAVKIEDGIDENQLLSIL